MTVFYGMDFRSYEFRPQEPMSIRECLEGGVIGSENWAVVLSGG